MFQVLNRPDELALFLSGDFNLDQNHSYKPLGIYSYLCRKGGARLDDKLTANENPDQMFGFVVDKGID